MKELGVWREGDGVMELGCEEGVHGVTSTLWGRKGWDLQRVRFWVWRMKHALMMIEVRHESEITPEFHSF